MVNNIRVGIGYDIHLLVPGKRLILGGVAVPFAKGLDGWSDADVLTHAVIEALLGAAALGDIGQHFPPGDLQYKDISSLVLLGKMKGMLAQNGWHIVNIDVTVVTEEPRLKDYIDPMRQMLGKTLSIATGNINIKASTNNGIGSIGRGEGIAAYAVALIEGDR